MRTMLALVAVLVCFSSCATKPGIYMFNNEERFPSEYDRVWGAVISYFAESSIPVKTLEKASGFIVAESVGLPTDWMDCGKAGIMIDGGFSGNFNVLVTKEDDGSCNVKVTTNFWCIRSFGDTSSRITCNSNGSFEEGLLSYIRRRAGTDINLG